MIDLSHRIRFIAWLKGCSAAGLSLRRAARRSYPVPAASFCLALVAGCAGTSEFANPPRVSLADLRLVEMNLVEQRYVAKLRIQNPNDAPLRVRGMEYTIHVNGRKFADGVRGRDFSVPAYGESLIEVNLTSTVLRIVEQIRDLSDGEPKALRYRISGSLSISGTRKRIPFLHEDVLDLSADAGSVSSNTNENG